MQNVGIGIDLVEFESMHGLCQNPRFLKRVYSSAELSYCQTKRDPVPFLAARFAAKEAVVKALGSLKKKIYYRQIEVLKKSNGAVGIRLAKHSDIKILLSISHGRRSAVAVAWILTK